MKTRKQFCCLLVLASCVLVGQSQASQITLSCADPNARPVYPEGPPGSNQCTIFNQTQSQLEVVLVARDDAAATQAQIVKVDGEADDFAGNPTFNFGACGTGGIPPSHVVDRVRVDGQCTFTVNFVTDEPGPPEVGKEDNDKTTWRLDVFVHADKRAGELVNTASASAFIVVGDAGTVPEPTSFALIAMGGLLVCLPRVLASIRSGIVGALVHERNGG